MHMFRRISAAMLLVAMTVALTACSDGIEGSWKLTGGNAIGAIYSLDSGSDLALSDAEVIFRFKGDGALVIDMTRAGTTSSAGGTWEESGDRLALILDGNTVKCSYSVDDDVLTIFFTYQGQNANFVFSRL